MLGPVTLYAILLFLPPSGNIDMTLQLTTEAVLAARKRKAVLDLHHAIEVKAEQDAHRVGVAREGGVWGRLTVLLERVRRGLGERVGRVLEHLEEDLGVSSNPYPYLSPVSGDTYERVELDALDLARSLNVEEALHTRGDLGRGRSGGGSGNNLGGKGRSDRCSHGRHVGWRLLLLVGSGE